MKSFSKAPFYIVCFFLIILAAGQTVSEQNRLLAKREAIAQRHEATLYLRGTKGAGLSHQERAAEAMKWYRKAGDVVGGQVKVAQSYEVGGSHLGLSDQERVAEAIKWWHKAAENGSGMAQLKLGERYNRGEGVAQDPTEALKWFRKAAGSKERGVVYVAQNYLRSFQRAKESEIRRAEARAAALKDPVFLRNEAFSYLAGKKGHGLSLQERTTEVMKWYRKAGDVVGGQVAVADSYENGFLGSGLSYPERWAESIKWWRKAAENGSSEAHSRLGHMYRWGQGVVVDLTEALKWWRKAAEADSWDAGHARSVVEVLQARIQLAKYAREAAGQGHVQAQFDLAWYYEQGEGVPKDLAEAIKWYHKAAEHGHMKAQYRLAQKYERGEGVQRDVAEAIKWYRKVAEQKDISEQDLKRVEWDLRRLEGPKNPYLP